MRHKSIKAVVAVSVLLGIYLTAMIPDGAPSVETIGQGKSFAWNQDDYWQRLETRFVSRRSAGCEQVVQQVGEWLNAADARVQALTAKQILADVSVARSLEETLFDAAVAMGACPSAMRIHGEAFWKIRSRIRTLFQNQNVTKTKTRETLYRLLYGSRIAYEQAVLVSNEFPTLHPLDDAPSHRVPSATVHGVTIQSGDLLLSRGTAPTSAFIARGNDFPGNFSHVALVHVSEDKTVSVIEAHIEKGVAVTDVDGYLKDKKFRILVLRLREDVPERQMDPALPHKAATRALERANREHIPYDFSMDYENADKLFCSEVASSAYGEYGVQLWQALSHISNPVVVRWMRDFGVRRFITQAPSDLEYDPTLQVVHEWRSQSGLIYDTVDNAVVDAMIDTGNADKSLPYNTWMLPVARSLKLYSCVMNLFDRVGPVPEGMNATAALRNRAFRDRHRAVQKRVLQQVEQFKADHGYFPPYWRLVQIAKEQL